MLLLFAVYIRVSFCDCNNLCCNMNQKFQNVKKYYSLIVFVLENMMTIIYDVMNNVL